MTWIANRNNSNITGKVCEAIAISYFIGEGSTVTIPFGNQSGWDILINRHSGLGWERVQVKAVRESYGNLVSSICKHEHNGKSARKITSEDTDLVVCVYPEEGKVWVITPDIFSRSVSVFLQPATKLGLGIIRVSKGDKIRDSKKRRLMASTIEEKPDGVSDMNWEIFLRFKGGMTYKALGSLYAIDQTSIRDRVERVIRKVQEV